MLKRFLLFAIGTFLLFTPGHACADFKKIKIAVLDFQQNGKFETPDVGKMVAEWFTTSLVETGRFDIIERRLLQQIIEEQKMGASGIIDARSASQIGRVLGVKTVVTGTVQSFEGRLEVNARLISVETGSIIAAEKVIADSAARLTDLVRQISAKIIRAFPLEGYVVQRSGERIIIDLGRQAGVQGGMLFSIYTEGRTIKHPRTGEVLDVEKNEKGVARITEVKQKTSYGTILREAAPSAVKSGQFVRALLNDEDERPEPVPTAEARPAEKPVPPPPPVVEAVPEPVRKAPVATGRSRVLAGHADDIMAIAFSDRGDLAATGDKGKTIILWDARNWVSLARLTGHRNDVRTLRFSPDGRLLASGSRDDTVIIWNVADRRQLKVLKVGDTVNAVAFSPDGTLLATGANTKTNYIWDVKSGTKMRTLKGKDDVLALAFSPDGRLLATAGKDRAISLWEAHSGKLLRTLAGHEADVLALLFTPGGKLVSAGEDKRVILWSIGEGSRMRALSGHDDNVFALAASSDGRRLVSGDGRKEGGIIIWDTAKGEEVRRMSSEERFNALALSPDGRSLLLGCDRNLVLVRLDQL